jgi:hypothetical protein
VTPLELLHSGGWVEYARVLGDGCPPALVPTAAAGREREVDLVVIAPTRAQLRKRGWLAGACDEAARALSPDGLVYALVPRGRRRAARRRRRAAGLLLDSRLAQLPGGAAPRYLVPLEAAVWRHALTHLIGARPATRRVLAVARALPLGEPLVAAVLPEVATLARHPGGVGVAAWAASLGEQPGAGLVVATSWRGPAGPVVAYPFAEGARRPWGVVKIGPDSAREAAALGRLGAAARAAGARVPRVLGVGQVGGSHVRRDTLGETLLEGEPAARLLGRSPERFDAVAAAVADWLERWNAATAQPARLAADRLERELVAPAAELGDGLPPAYRDWLAARCAAATGTELPLVAAHNDLTMWNVLVDGDALGILDWAEAEDAGLPLTDFFYAIADAAAACHGYANRLAAVRDCFEPGGRRAAAVAPLRERLRSSLALAEGVDELALHACWLHHAANELRDGGDGSFLAIARWLAGRVAA